MTRDTDGNPKGGDAKLTPGDSLTAGAGVEELRWFAQQIFNGIDTGMLRIETPADETLANVLRRGRKALKGQKPGGEAMRPETTTKDSNNG